MDSITYQERWNLLLVWMLTQQLTKEIIDGNLLQTVPIILLDMHLLVREES